MALKILKTFFIFTFFLFAIFSYQSVRAVNLVEVATFNVNRDFDASLRSQISAVLVKITPNLYFYVEKDWWDSQVQTKKNEILYNLDGLSNEFDKKIYPTLTSVYGSEWKPGVDGDNKITILFQSMKENVAGYFSSSDEYIKIQVPTSNEREMLYLSIAHIDDPKLKVFVSHEFTHLITFNQKNRTQGIEEEIWLNEARADYTSTILGYDDTFEGSNLQKRLKDFLNSPTDSLTEWKDTKYDYAVVNMFVHYLVDHYSVSVLYDSMKLKSVGMASINEILLKNGVKENFSQIFTNWVIATFINDCSYNLKYCYLNQNLKGLRINPTLNFLPLAGNSSLSVTNVTKNWVGNWQKIIGGNGNLKLEFKSLAGLDFQIPYIVFDKNNKYSIKFLSLDNNQKGEINIDSFGKEYISLVIAPSLQNKFSGFNGIELTYPYTFTVSITEPVPKEDQELIQKLLAQIDSLKKQIADIQLKNNNQGKNSNLCISLNNNLYFGVLDKSDVICLQNFLRLQSPSIYPEGLITGNFGNLTKSAVMRFQRKYGILQTGFVGILTRTKINSLLNNNER